MAAAAQVGGVATRETVATAESIQAQLNDRDIRGLGAAALSTAGGVVLAQEVADIVLPMANFSPNPTTATGFAASASVKTVLALALAAVARSMGGLGLVVAAFASLGSLAGAGADAINAVQQANLLPGNAPMAAGYQQPQAQAVGSGNRSGPQSSSHGGAAATADGGYFG